jgi:hypothetical protein
MNVVFDTDILSCIGKTEIFDLIKIAHHQYVFP